MSNRAWTCARQRLRFVDTHTIQKVWLGNRTRDSSAMNATETETETARNTNHVDALRRMSNAFLYESGRQISRTIE